MTVPIRAVIVDDEAMSRRALRTLLSDVDWIECVGEAVDAASATESLRSLRPDLVFLDIQLPGGTGLQVLERYGEPVGVIFTTAFDDYAMTAFELGAIDYLRKPFGQARLLRALERARAQLDSSARAAEVATLQDRLAIARPSSKPLQRIFVRDRGAVVPLKVNSIARCEADGDYVAIHAAGRRHLVYVNLGDLERRLDPESFVRVHRSHIVNLDFVESFTSHDPNRLEVLMKDGSRVVASRMGTQLLRARIR
jgi:two-component system LytT family response regulator